MRALKALLDFFIDFFTALYDFTVGNWAIVLAAVLGLVAVYVLLPKPRRRPILLGVAVACAALLVSGFFIVRVGRLSSPEQFIEAFLFYAFAATAIVAGGLLVTQENPARAALSFALVILAVSGLFLLQAAPFLMAATIIVYAGAIIVIFLFVLMLSQQQGLSDADARSREPFLASMTGFLLVIALLYILKISFKPDLDRWVARSEARLAEVQELRRLEEKREDTPAKKREVVRNLIRFRNDYERWLRNETAREEKGQDKREPKPLPLGTRKLYEALYDLESLPPNEDRMAAVNLQELENKMTSLVEAGKKARGDPLLGGLRPAGGERMSELSGPSSGRPVEDLRRDEMGRPQMPGENTVYLGRSLFTDYLLPVELAGTLLLVAAIGAIAIAHRKDIEQRGTAASTNGAVPRRSA